MMAIDFRKAFDSKAFSFIKALLQFFKFNKSLIDWIMILLEDFIVEIIQAGKIFLKNQHRKRIQTRRPNRKSSAHPLYRNPANKNQNSKHSQALQTHIQTKPLQGRNCKKKKHGRLCRRHNTQHQKLYRKPAGSNKHHRKLWEPLRPWNKQR